jgi:hypothetical protein
VDRKPLECSRAKTHLLEGVARRNAIASSKPRQRRMKTDFTGQQHGLYGTIPKFGLTGISNFDAIFT